MDKMELLHSENRNCFEDVTVTVSNWYQRHYEYMYQNSWTFQYDLDNTQLCIGKRLICHAPDQFIFFTEHSGIEIRQISHNGADEGIAFIKEELEKDRIVSLTTVDMFWLPWTSDYQKAHGGHSFLIKQFDEVTETLICMDPYLQLREVKLSKENFLYANHGKIITYDVVHSERTDFPVSDLIKETANRLLQKQNGNNAFDLIRLFSNDIEESYDLKNEMKGYEMWFSIPIYTSLQMLGRRRMQYAQLLKFYASKVENNQEILAISEELYKVGKLWDKLKILFGKECIMKDFHLVRKKAPSKIRVIADLEEKCARGLLKIQI